MNFPATPMGQWYDTLLSPTKKCGLLFLHFSFLQEVNIFLHLNFSKVSHQISPHVHIFSPVHILASDLFMGAFLTMLLHQFKLLDIPGPRIKAKRLQSIKAKRSGCFTIDWPRTRRGSSWMRCTPIAGFGCSGQSRRRCTSRSGPGGRVEKLEGTLHHLSSRMWIRIFPPTKSTQPGPGIKL